MFWGFVGGLVKRLTTRQMLTPCGPLCGALERATIILWHRDRKHRCGAVPFPRTPGCRVRFAVNSLNIISSDFVFGFNGNWSMTMIIFSSDAYNSHRLIVIMQLSDLSYRRKFGFYYFNVHRWWLNIWDDRYSKCRWFIVWVQYSNLNANFTAEWNTHKTTGMCLWLGIILFITPSVFMFSE